MAIVLFGSVLSWYWKYYQDLGPSCFSAVQIQGVQELSD
jgi:hypothetical protein